MANKQGIDRLFLQEAKLMRVKHHYGTILFTCKGGHEFLPPEPRSNK